MREAQLDWFLVVNKTRETMTVQGNIMGLPLDFHISPSVPAPSYHFSRRQRLLHDVMCPKTIKKLRIYRKCPIFLPELYQIWGFSRYIFIKVPNTKFHRYPFSGSRADTCGLTETVMTTGAFRYSANAPTRVSCLTKK